MSNKSDDDEQHEVTRLLAEWNRGNRQALDSLLPIVYRELRRLARHQIARERNGHTLESAALVNEAYVRLVQQRSAQWQNRAHFFAIAARIMRRILVDYARSRRYAKRGSGVPCVTLKEASDLSQPAEQDLVLIDLALNRLASIDERKSRIVELKFFAGLTVEETAEVLKISPRTVMREWGSAKAWLLREITRETAFTAKTERREESLRIVP